jgi:hypothetical protein
MLPDHVPAKRSTGFDSVDGAQAVTAKTAITISKLIKRLVFILGSFFDRLNLLPKAAGVGALPAKVIFLHLHAGLLFFHSSKLKNRIQGFLTFVSLFLYVVPKYTTDKKSDKDGKSS